MWQNIILRSITAIHSGLLNVILECLKGAPEEDQEQLRMRIQEKEDWINNIEKIKIRNDVDPDVR